jgi:deoxyhypusine synthase
MMDRSFHDGQQDGLEPLESLDLSKVRSYAELLRAMRRTAFSGRRLGEAFEVLLAAVADQQCRLVLTVSGAMTVAKQGSIFCELIDRGIVHAVVATGALIAHGLTESIGRVHYQHDPEVPDETLFARGYNRVYDTLEMEANLNDVEQFVASVFRNQTPAAGAWSSAEFCRAIGRRLDQLDEGPGVLRSAYRQDVPVFIPAFTDSELGLDVAIQAMFARITETGADPATLGPDDLFAAVPPFNPFLDLQQYARLIAGSPRWGILTIGGGVPRNWAQQVGPYVDVVRHRLGASLKPPRFQYGVRVCPEPVHWGGLSGCSYEEGVSWGKFVPPSEGGRYAEVYADATLVLPVLMKALFEELDRQGHSPGD